MTIESRPLRYFVVVARERSFARAAEQLSIAGPALSRAIRKLESDLGTQLLERTTRSVALTPSGAVFLVDAERALEALDAAATRARRAAERRILLAVKADTDGGLLEPILESTARQDGAEPVSVRLCRWGEHADLLRRGEVDAALIHEPFDRRGLDAEIILEEPRVAAVPRDPPSQGDRP